MSHDQRTFVPINLSEKCIETELLSPLLGFHAYVQKMRDGDKEIGPALFESLIRLFHKADSESLDLRLLGAYAPDQLYIRIAELTIMDQFTCDFCRVPVNLLFDQLRARGVNSFYILDNEIRGDRFTALAKLTTLAGIHVVSPNIDSSSYSEIIESIQYHVKLRHHIIYAERDAKLNYLGTVQALAKGTHNVVPFRNLAPSNPHFEILSLGGHHSDDAEPALVG